MERHGPLTPSELAEREAIRRPTATQVVARLEEAGLVERTADPADRRAALISTTSSGRELLKRLRRRKSAYLASRLEKLPPEDRAALERAAAALERMLEDDAG